MQKALTLVSISLNVVAAAALAWVLQRDPTVAGASRAADLRDGSDASAIPDDVLLPQLYSRLLGAGVAEGVARHAVFAAATDDGEGGHCRRSRSTASSSLMATTASSRQSSVVPRCRSSRGRRLCRRRASRSTRSGWTPEAPRSAGTTPALRADSLYSIASIA